VQVGQLDEAMATHDPQSGEVRGWLQLAATPTPRPPEGAEALRQRLIDLGAPMCPPLPSEEPT